MVVEEKKYVSDRNYVKGEVFNVCFPDDGSFAQFTLKGPHPAIVIQDSTFPRKNVIVVPITGLLDTYGDKKKVIDSDIELPKSLPFLTKDSLIKTEQITRLSRKDLGERLGKLPDDLLIALDVQLISVLKLTDTVNIWVEKEIERRFGLSDTEFA